MPESIAFQSPASFLIVAPMFAVIALRLLHRSNRGSIGLSGLEYLLLRAPLRDRWRKAIRAIVLGLLACGLGILWAGPTVISSEPLFEEVEGVYRKNFVVALDTSPSMNLPADFKGYGGEDLKAGDEGVTRYEMAQAALLDFIGRFRGERFGLILFSTEPLLARWLTPDTSTDFAEVLDSIRRGSGTQLESFSALTNVDEALRMASRILERRGGAIILISDTEDDLESLGNAVRTIRAADLRLYVIGVGISEEIVQNLGATFRHDPGFRIFRVDSEAEMREAYRLVAEVEESPAFVGDGRSFEASVRWIGALLLFVVACLSLVATEMLWPAVRSGAHGGAAQVCNRGA